MFLLCLILWLDFPFLRQNDCSAPSLQVDVHQSPELKKQLGVRAVPTVKLHAGSLGQVASFTCGPKKAPQLERKIRLCKDVPGLAERLGKGGGMMEMVAGEINGGKPVRNAREWCALH